MSKEADRLERLGAELRDVVLSCYIYHLPHGKQPGWEEISEFSKRAWMHVAAALIGSGWRPPAEEGDKWA